MRTKATAVLLGLVVSMGSAAAQTLDQQINYAYENGDLPELHGAMVQLGGDTLAEVYFKGNDESWGQPLGVRDFGPDELHDIRSVTKSVVGLLYGIALQDGLVPLVDTPVFEALPGYDDLNSLEKSKITVGHLLTMQMGLLWDESLPYSDPRNSEVAMELAEDRYRYVLGQPLVGTPGQEWTYSGGALALVGKLISDGAGVSLDTFARERLFSPLGIESFEWIRGRDGVPSAASGLRMTLPDLTMIGRMVAQGGIYGGTQIVPAQWLDETFKARVDLGDGFRYGYLWYIAGSEETPVWLGLGNGGQRLHVQPDVDLIVTTFVGRYNDPEAWQTSWGVVRDFAVPEARRRLGKD